MNPENILSDSTKGLFNLAKSKKTAYFSGF